MGAVFKIESDEFVALANRLADFHHVSPEEAAMKAMRAQVAHEEKVRAKAAAIMAAAAEVRKHLRPGPFDLKAAMDELYGEDGLPA